MSDDAWLQIDGERYVHQAVDGEVLVIDTLAGLYFSLRGAAARVWPLLAAGVARGDLQAAAEKAFTAAPAEIRVAVDAVLDRLMAERVVRVGARPTDAGLGAAPDIAKGPLEPPAIERYEDMQDLLTLDPIHDVAESGWPNVPR